MASRDVELVIRAKDQTSKAFDDIVKSTTKFINSQKDIAKEAGSTGGALTRLAKSVGDINQVFRNIASANKIAKTLADTESAAAGLEAEIGGLNSQLSKLDAEMKTVAATQAKLAGESQRVEQSLTEQKAAHEGNQKALAETNAAVRTATVERGKLATEEKNLVTAIANSNAQLDKARARFEELQQAVDANEKPTQRLINSYAAASDRVVEYLDKIQQQSAALAATRANIESADQGLADLATQQALLSVATETTEASIAGLSGEMAKLGQQSRTVAKSQTELAKNTEQVGAALKGREADFARVNEALQETRATAQASAQTMDAYATTIRTSLKQALSAQQSTVSQINNAFQENRVQIRELAAVMGQAGVPTKAMADAMRDLQAAGQALEQEFRQQKIVQQQIGAAFRDTANDATAQANALRAASQQVAAGRTAYEQVAKAAQNAGTAQQRIVQQAQQTARAYRDAANNSRDLADANDKAADSYRRSANASRSALSYIQRLRGEVLALVSAYGGLQGAINILQGTVKVQQTLEGATSRLNAVNKGDVKATASDLDFIRRNANRLGIDMGTLANEFTKFAAATNNTAIAGKKTRDIFVSIAEAGRVSKLPLEDLEGIFKAVIQIASKGKFQLEELSGQLGDRLPGALQILADGMGITVDQLLKMTKDGEVMADNLINFAEELDRRYGGQLAKSLESTTTALGQLQNAAFQALHVFGEAGFIEGFTKLVRDLTEVLKDPAFLDFAARISAVLGAFASGIGDLAKNFQLLIPLISAFLGFKLVGVLTSMAGGFLTLGKSVGEATRWLTTGERAAKGVAGALGSTAPWIARTGTAAAAAAGSVGLLGRAFQLLFSSTGVGLIFTAVSMAIGLWATRASEATAALTEHRRIVDAVKDAYDKAGGSVAEWSKKLQGVTRDQAVASMGALKKAADDARQAVRGVFPSQSTIKREDPAAFKIAEQIRDLAKAYRETGGDVDEFKNKVQELSDKTVNSSVKDYALQVLNLADSTRETSDAFREAVLVVRALSGSEAERAKALDELNKRVYGSTDATNKANDAANQFKETLDALTKSVPGLKKEMKEASEIAETWGLILKAISELNFSNLSMANLGSIWDAFKGNYERSQAFQANQFDTTPLQSSLDTNSAELKAFYEQIKGSANLMTRTNGAGPYGNPWAPNFKNTNLSTIKSSSGLEVQVNKAAAAAFQGFLNELESIGYEVKTLGGYSKRNKVGRNTLSEHAYGNAIDINEKKNPFGKSLVTDMPANIGLIAAKYGLSWGGDWKSVKDAMHFEFTGKQPGGLTQASDAELKQQQDITKEKLKQQEQQRTFNQGLADSLEMQRTEYSMRNEDIIKREQAKAILQAEQELRKQGKTLNDEQRAQIEERVRLQYQEQSNQDALNKKKKEQEAIDQRVADLQTRSQELQAQYKLQMEMGDKTGAAATKTELEGVNAELQKAIAAAIQFYQAMGGPGSDAAIAKLKTMQLETQKVGMNAKSALIDWTRVGELFASGLTNAFDQFAQAVAEGKSVGEAARDAFLKFASDFLIQIGKMIIQQAILNLLRGLGGPFANLGLGGGAVGLAHTGGVVGSKRAGSGNGTRRISPDVIAGAPRFHEGGFPGLKPNEVPLVAKKGEEVLTKNDPRNALNGGATPQAGGRATNVRIINTFDSGDVVSQGLATGPGEEAIFNFVKGNARTINDILQQG